MTECCRPIAGGEADTAAIQVLLALALLLLSVLGAPPAGPHGQSGGSLTLASRDAYPDPTRTAAAIAPAPAAVTPGVAPPAAVAPAVIARSVVAPTFVAPTPGRFAGPRNRLVSADRTLDVAVGIYSDCTGNSPIDVGRADLDPCFYGRAYFVGHSPGVFTPLLQMRPGSLLTWFDANGYAKVYRVIAIRDFRRNSAPLTLARPDVVAQFQTCLTTDGSLDRILDAVLA